MVRELIAKIQGKTVKNGIWLYLLQFFNTVVPLITLPYITRLLGASQYGIFTIALNIIGYLQVVVEYGFTMSATRKVALSNRDQNALGRLFSTVLISRGFLLICCAVFVCIYAALSCSAVQSNCLMIMLISLVGCSVQQNWLFQGMQEMRYISCVNMISRVISVALIFLVVKTENDLYAYCFLNSLAPLLSGLIAVFIVRKQYGVRVKKVHVREVFEELKSGWYVFTTSLSSKVFGAIGITFLGMFADSSTVGVYSAIQKIPMTIMLGWYPIAQILYPIVSQKMRDSFEEGKKFVFSIRRYVMAVFGAVSILVWIFSRTLIEIAFGQEYLCGVGWLVPILLWVLVSISNNFLGVQILLGSGHDPEYSQAFQFGVVCTLVFNLVLIYFGGGTGAAWAPLLSECVLWIMLKKKICNIQERYH